MKRIIRLYLFALIILLVSCDNSQPQPRRKNMKPIEMKQTDISVVTAGNQLGFEIMQEILADSTNQNNVMISPLSITYALGMTYNGARNATQTGMGKTMHLADLPMADINASYKHLEEALTTVDDKVDMQLANSLWYQQSFEVQDSFINLNKTYYNARVEALDFSSADAPNTINQWVADATNNRIPKIVNQISPLDMMMLINAVYFKGQWRYPFNEDQTRNAAFHLRDSSTIQVPTMHEENDFNYISHKEATGVELPYGRGNFSMVLMLPPEGHYPEDLMAKLAGDNFLQNALAGADTTKKLQVYLPKFTFSSELSLTTLLQNLGMERAFDAQRADFGNINPNMEDLHISRVKHKSFIEVNEEGTEAAAATSVTMGVTSVRPSPDIIRFNRPFVFLIREQSTGAILFAGKVENPRKE